MVPVQIDGLGNRLVPQSHQLHPERSADRESRTAQCRKRHRWILRVKQPVELAPVGLHAGRHPGLGEAPCLPCLADLIGNDLLEGNYYGYNRYGGRGVGGVLSLVLVILLVLWLVGALGGRV